MWGVLHRRYCRSEGANVTVQISFVSSYAAIRLWRVLYKDGNCNIDRFAGGAHVCRDDVAIGFPLDPARNIPAKLNEAAQGCMAFTEYNLLVESVEYYDDLNLVVAVRRGTIQDLTDLVQGNPAGHMVFYFVSTQNLTLVRESEPWTSTVPPAVLSGTGILCPALRFLPSLGTFFAKSTAAFFQGLRFLLNLLSNPFALLELVRARALGLCPSPGLHHSALDDCGMGLFQLDDFFRSLYAANTAFWDFIAWIASLFSSTLSSSGSPAARYFETFLKGTALYGEASQMVSLYEVTDAASIFDTGIQDTVLGGARRRRRLLSDEQGPPKRKLMGWKTRMAKRVGSGMFWGFLRMLSGIFTKSLSMSQSLTSSMMLRATSADYSVLLNMENPTYMLGSAVSAPTIAWAHFSYLTAVPIGLDIAALLLFAQQKSDAQNDFFLRAIASTWVNLFESSDHYEQLIANRLFQGCQVLFLFAL